MIFKNRDAVCGAFFFVTLVYGNAFADDCHVEKQATLPITFSGFIPTLPITINGHAINIGIDTGAQNTLLTPETVEMLNLPIDAHHIVNVTGSNGASVARTAIMEDLEFAGAHYPHHDATVLSLEHHQTAEETRDFGNQSALAGLIGADILSNYDIEYDVPQKTWTFYRVSNCSALTPPWQGPYVKVPVSISPTKRFIFPVMLDGNKLHAIFDSGSSGMRLALSSALAMGVTQDMLAGDPVRISTGVGGKSNKVASHRFNEITLGRETFRGPRTDIVDFPATEADMLIGEDYMHARRFWLSYATQTLFIQRVISTK